ncbi:hypothetical protein LENED_006212 [Lentinula edodes]|uniref:Uncharacterized protein n=1 Tax=Lentinula edodes TaxID=5353 RepID=A0A1Q3EB05_LENED|nr:hypothetical protein LENED_006212 [Lentinula edodes]
MASSRVSVGSYSRLIPGWVYSHSIWPATFALYYGRPGTQLMLRSALLKYRAAMFAFKAKDSTMPYKL